MRVYVRGQCRIDGCDSRIAGQGLCTKHYTRWRTYGDPLYLQVCSPHFTAQERLKFHGWDISETGCWEFNGYIDKLGYGVVAHNGKQIKAHRLAYETWVGAINGLFVLHHCDNRKCINPKHLFLGTQTDNMRDMVAKGRYVNGRKYAGADSHLAKMTWDEVREMRTEYAKGILTQKMLAEIYGMSQGQVSRIVRGLDWVDTEEAATLR